MVPQREVFENGKRVTAWKLLTSQTCRSGIKHMPEQMAVKSPSFTTEHNTHQPPAAHPEKDFR